VHLNNKNDMSFWLLLSKVIDRLMNKFSCLHSEFIKTSNDCTLLDDHNLIGLFARIGDIWELVELPLEEKIVESFVMVSEKYTVIFKLSKIYLILNIILILI
jgi:hypothetical protein